MDRYWLVPTGIDESWVIDMNGAHKMVSGQLGVIDTRLGRSYPVVGTNIRLTTTSQVGEFVPLTPTEGNVFGQPRFWVRNYGGNQSWGVTTHDRFIADVNGDGKADIVGFTAEGVLVSLAH